MFGKLCRTLIINCDKSNGHIPNTLIIIYRNENRKWNKFQDRPFIGLMSSHWAPFGIWNGLIRFGQLLSKDWIQSFHYYSVRFTKDFRQIEWNSFKLNGQLNYSIWQWLPVAVQTYTLKPAFCSLELISTISVTANQTLEAIWNKLVLKSPLITSMLSLGMI